MDNPAWIFVTASALIAPASISLSGIAPAARAVTLATVGAYSYGLYLIHQPYMIDLAIRVRELAMPAAVAAGLALVAVLTILSMFLERYVNRATARFFAPSR